MVLADVLVKGKRTGEAISVGEHLVSLDPANSAHKLALAGLYWDTGKQEKATELLKEVVSADKKNEVGRLQAAMFYLSKGKADDAEGELIRRDPAKRKELQASPRPERTLREHEQGRPGHQDLEGCSGAGKEIHQPRRHPGEECPCQNLLRPAEYGRGKKICG